MENNKGIVYVLSNPAMPGLVKIGSTTHESVTIRMSQLYTTGVPFPFDCEYAALVADVTRVEKAFHTAFGPDRLNPRREFFEIEASQAIAIIKLLEIEDVTPQVKSESDMTDHADREAGEQYTKRRPRFSFLEMNIPIGATIICTNNGEEAIVETDRTVRYNDEEMSLTSATRTILDNSYNVAPGPYWMYEGKRLREIYNETYSHE